MNKLLTDSFALSTFALLINNGSIRVYISRKAITERQHTRTVIYYTAFLFCIQWLII